MEIKDVMKTIKEIKTERKRRSRYEEPFIKVEYKETLRERVEVYRGQYRASSEDKIYIHEFNHLCRVSIREIPMEGIISLTRIETEDVLSVIYAQEDIFAQIKMYLMVGAVDEALKIAYENSIRYYK